MLDLRRGLLRNQLDRDHMVDNCLRAGTWYPTIEQETAGLAVRKVG